MGNCGVSHQEERTYRIWPFMTGYVREGLYEKRFCSGLDIVRN